eukprot:CAMPEP_0114543504 /NCGR_PEP_ID=MMETSP0114-20121206/2390_1 /TAXON_ID=31324 /ORGANISM="Goniomonas sp, Strain m" /LENGTH=606 /DNA_ID=CAMNT_0001727845 /DNA_START=18 /DNA_END=1838 /DNA_ORIENTATION=+
MASERQSPLRLSSLLLACVVLATAAGPPYGPGHEECGPLFGRDAPQFHVRDTSCAENDPNGPFYDATHGVYHLFYQDHLAESHGGVGKGPDWGHAVSKDLAHWAHLPVALWNDQWYDLAAVFTGSTTIVDGKPVIVYPGICDKSHEGCETGTALAIAVPENPSDPLLTNWTKPSYNPVVNNTQRDPSTAWQTSDGEWRLTTYDGLVYNSWNFVHWEHLGTNPIFPVGECPSLFPLPRVCPGCDEGFKGTLPSHVHKCSHDGDWMQVGSYIEGPANTTGRWEATPGVDFSERKIDAGAFYASKDFYDPVKQRRINWGWAIVPPASTQTLPREVMYHPVLQQLTFPPVEELTTLRDKTLTYIPSLPLSGNQTYWLGDWPESMGNTSEVSATFKLPAHAATFGIGVMVGLDSTGTTNVSANVFVSYTPSSGSSPYTVTVGVEQQGEPLQQWMNNTDCPGNDYNVTDVDYHDAVTCQDACNEDAKCEAWTYVVRPPKYASCCLKAPVPSCLPRSGLTSGVKHPGPAPGSKITDTLSLLPTETELDVRVFVDNTFLEVFWMSGRVAMTVPLKHINQQAGMTVFTTEDVVASSVSAWTMSSIWVPAEEIAWA